MVVLLVLYGVSAMKTTSIEASLGKYSEQVDHTMWKGVKYYRIWRYAAKTHVHGLSKNVEESLCTN